MPTNLSKAVKEWRKNTKLKLITCMGSRCQLCGYDKCNDALEFHHIEPTEKDFSFGAIRANPKNWESIKRELEKCILLCSNCHREIHKQVSLLPTIYQKFDEKLLEQDQYKHLLKQTEKTYCPVCNNLKNNANKYCSLTCASTFKFKVDWTTINLIDLIENQKLSKTAIAELLGCSDAAVGKHYRKLKRNYLCATVEYLVEL